jgi:hypothetical protein
MEHHRCYRIYNTKTCSTRISDTVAFQHQYITNPMVSPESHVIVAAQQFATALKGNIPTGNKMAEALTMVSTLFAKIAAAKLDAAAAKEQCSKLRTYPAARQMLESPPPSETTPIPRVGTTPTAPIPKVAESPQVNYCITPDDCRVSGSIVASPQNRPRNIPNYISQDEDNDKSPAHRYPTQSTTRSIMQEAMLSCIDFTQKTYTITPQQMSRRRMPMSWELTANSSNTGT